MRSVHMFEELSDDGTVVGSFTKSVAAMKIYDDDRYIDIDYDAGAFKNDALTSNVYKNSFKISPVAYDGGDAASRVETTSRAVTVLPAVAMSAFPAVLPSGVGVPSLEAHDAVDGVDLNSTALLYASSASNRTLSGGGTASSFGSTLLASTAGPRAVDEDINSFYFYETEQFTVLWILFFMIVLGNTAVLITLVLNKNRKSRMNFFIKQLAAADLAVGLINVLTDIVWRITITWHAGNAACKLIRFLQAVVTFASTYVLVALSIDRYDAITHPMNFSGSWKRARLLVIAAWMLSTLFSIPMIFLFKETIVEGQTQCWIALQTWQWQVYMTLIAVVLFLVPAVIISACYTVIVRTIWSKSKLLLVPPTAGVHHHGRPHGEDHRNLRHHNNDDLHDCRRASSRGIIPKAKIKTVKMTFVIVFVFVICWSPYIVFDLLQVYGFIPRTQTNIAIATLIQSLAPLNSAANPVIYCLFSTHMCRTLRKLPPFKWLTCCLNLCIPGLETPGTTSNGSMGGVGAAGGGSGSNGSGTGRRLIGGGRVRFGTRSGDSTRTTTLTTTTSTSRRSGGSGSVSSLRQHTVRIAQPPVQLANKHGVAGLGGAVTYGVRQQHRVAVSVV